MELRGSLLLVATGLQAPRPRRTRAANGQQTSEIRFAQTCGVAASQIGLQLGAVSPASAAGLVAAGLLSVVISPALALVLLRREQPAIWSAERPPQLVLEEP